MPNHLASETSPYLLQHAGNPVDWYPWGPEALARSAAEDRPIFLSIGYSACHWCHVMEHESFEDAGIAALMNQHFVCVKVDREERPDLDQIYMNAVQAMTGRGGWPMSVFLTPGQEPFYGGTYWPPTARMGMPGFDQVLIAVADAWQNRREQATQQATALSEHLRQAAAPRPAGRPLDRSLVLHAVMALEQAFDPRHGGFGPAPKFPHPMDLRLLMRAWHHDRDDGLLRIVSMTLDKMARGGMYDQLGGGFHRYSVDEQWLVPHFEKMLYDNALLVPCYLEAFLMTGNLEFKRVAHETCDYVLREMTDPAGGFYSTQDADSEGEEGKFFVWTPDEIEALLDAPLAQTFCTAYGVTSAGNFEHGHSILHLAQPLAELARQQGRPLETLRDELHAARQRLFAQREARVHPGLDDKVLVAWNGLMIDALALASGVLDEPRYLQAAQRAADFLLAHLRRADGRLLHGWRHGRAKLDAYLDDYACLANALVSLYEADFDERWIDEALRLADNMLAHFHDSAGGGFYFTATDHEPLLARQKDLYDNAVPSGNSMAALALLRLGRLTGRADLLAAAEGTLRAASGVIEAAPRAAGQMLLALDFYLGPTREIVILGNPDRVETAEALADLRSQLIPNKVVASRAGHAEPQAPRPLDALFAGKSPQPPEPTVYVCEQFACQAPRSGLDAARATWRELAAAPR